MDLHLAGARVVVGTVRLQRLQRKLLLLAQETGRLNAAEVVAGLSLTREEADAALTKLARDGLAELDLDENGAPVYRVQKVHVRA